MERLKECHCKIIQSVNKSNLHQKNKTASPQSNYGDPGTLLVGGCWLADGSRRRGHHLGTQEERWWGGACQGRVRCAGRRWGRVAEEQGEDEELEEEERENEFRSCLNITPPSPHTDISVALSSESIFRSNARRSSWELDNSCNLNASSEAQSRNEQFP